MYRYIYFVSLLIRKMDAAYNSLLDKEPVAVEKGRRVCLMVPRHQ